MLLKLYLKLVLQKPLLVISAVLVLTLSLGWNAQYFTLDASSDALVVEGDGDLEYSRLIDQRYANGEFVFVAYQPFQNLFSSTSLATLNQLKDELLALERVESIDSILDVPLFKVAGVSLSEIADNIVNLNSPGIDLEAAQDDLMNNDAYRDVLLSEDAQTASLVVNFSADRQLGTLLESRTELRSIIRTGTATEAQIVDLKQTEQNYATASKLASANLHQDIIQIREILNNYRSDAYIVMGGVPMIADDLITFVKSDLRNFGLAIFIFIICCLSYLFRKPRYVFIPLLCCAVTSLCVTGMLGLFNWPVTVISSNFLSLLLIITISLNVHLMVRYRELEKEQSEVSHHDRIKMSINSMIKPCTYTSLTTIVAFGSLVVSGIPPIINFGLMMVLGVFSALSLTFLLFPAVLSLLPENLSLARKKSLDLTPVLAQVTSRHGSAVLLVAGMLFVFAIFGLSRLKVENSFIDYFDDSTEIYQGMVFIDQNLGGTTPLDVIIELSPPNPFDNADFDDGFGGFEDDNFGFDEFEEDFSNSDEVDEDAYWFTSDKMQEVIEIHNFLDSIPETGKVLSLATLIKLAYELNDDKALSSIELALLYNAIPQEYKESLLRPYVSVEHDQVRFSIRILETEPNLVRSELLEKIEQGLQTEFSLAPEQVHLTGMLVLYNNMLQSLFKSQILTLSLVLGVIMLMFIILFRSIKLAILGIIPNILAAATVLGLMGWLGIPLDMMTITIAAISVGIGVDNTIHYIHRFKSQFPKYQDYQQTMSYCHSSIGQAMYFTSFTIVVGFSLLVFSNFIPTIYFGLLISLAMIIALTGALTLLPQLLITFKPFR